MRVIQFNTTFLRLNDYEYWTSYTALEERKKIF